MQKAGSGIPMRVAKQFSILILAALASGWISGPVAAQTSNLVFSSVTISGIDLIISGSGGLPGAGYYVMASTNPGVPPLALWNMISTNVFAANGQFTNTIPIDPTVAQDFFIISMNIS